MNRREFIGAITLPAALAAVGGAGGWTAIRPREARRGAWEEVLNRTDDRSPEDAAGAEDFWIPVQEAFTIDRGVINLNNGGCSPAPRAVQEAQRKHLEYANTMPPPYALWRVQEPAREAVRQRLARQWGADPEEIALTRNSSESLQICQLGIDLKPGDEVLTTTQDYPRMITTFKQRARRDGIVLKQVKIPIPCEDDDAIVRAFEEGVTPRTKMILVSHIVNITGQILPVRRVVEMARRKGDIPVIVDGAHALAHFDFALPDLGCDYYGVSLHKWLFAPHGNGLLYVRKERIAGLWSLMASDEKNVSDIRKFEEIGTHPVAQMLAMAEALTFHQAIGGARKEARLRYLRDRWAKRLLDSGKGRVRLHTSLKEPYSCGIATFEIDSIDPAKLADHLWDTHRILTVAIVHDEFKGIRVTPSVYTTMEELDRFCEAVERVLAKGLPA